MLTPVSAKAPVARFRAIDVVPINTELAPNTAPGIVPLKLPAANAVALIVMFAPPLKLVAVPVTAPLIAIVLAVANVVAVPALPSMLMPVSVCAALARFSATEVLPINTELAPSTALGIVPLKLPAASAVALIVMFVLPSKLVAVPVTAPLIAIVRAAAKAVAVGALTSSAPALLNTLTVPTWTPSLILKAI